jgi:hypothetical protein
MNRGFAVGTGVRETDRFCSPQLSQHPSCVTALVARSIYSATSIALASVLTWTSLSPIRNCVSKPASSRIMPSKSAHVQLLRSTCTFPMVQAELMRGCVHPSSLTAYRCPSLIRKGRPVPVKLPLQTRGVASQLNGRSRLSCGASLAWRCKISSNFSSSTPLGSTTLR